MPLLLPLACPPILYNKRHKLLRCLIICQIIRARGITMKFQDILDLFAAQKTGIWPTPWRYIANILLAIQYKVFILPAIKCIGPYIVIWELSCYMRRYILVYIVPHTALLYATALILNPANRTRYIKTHWRKKWSTPTLAKVKKLRRSIKKRSSLHLPYHSSRIITQLESQKNSMLSIRS